MLTYDMLIASITHWAEQDPQVRAAVIVGSRARTDHPADAWSDLDVVLFVRDLQPYIATDQWVSAFGPVWLTFIERTGDGRSWERRALYAGGLDVDFALNPAEWLEGMARQDLDPATVDVLRRGTRALVDKDGWLAQALAKPVPLAAPFAQPSAGEFGNVVSDFWYHAQWSAKHLRRGELWWAKSGSDWHMKALLQQMLEWHAHATQAAGYDTWMRGRFLEEWADPRAVAQLSHCFAHFDAADIASALQATLSLFDWLAAETAQAWGYTYPLAGIAPTLALTQELLQLNLGDGSKPALH